MSTVPDPQQNQARARVIEMVGVGKRYGNVEVLKPVDLSIEDGEFLTILGPSGSGKTTIIRMIGGFTRPTSGRILLDGRDIVDQPIFDRPFNTVFQDYALFPHMSVAKNIAYGLMVRGRPKAEISRKVAEALAVVDLSDKAARYPADLSGGQRQRVALARAIICEPRVVLLDEPLAALDAELRRSMRDFLKDLQRRIRTTFIFITHDQDEAISISDRIVVMDHGRVEQVGTPEEIYYHPKSVFVAKFFGESNLLAGGVTALAGTDAVIESALGTLTKPGHAGLNAGTAVTLAARPESFRLVAGDGPRAGECDVSGTVEAITFLGATSQLVVGIAGAPGETIKVRAATKEISGKLAVGDSLTVAWTPADISVLAG
ncbi:MULTISPECIES: ABC transporter ATP-binding protein [Rhodomicrobium]|uniref:ABC transporter ATP-binding protein n=1 Tax=Rhodomicrobium TaxID=1068 RepID=UPI001FD9ADDF|nr:MULTISPECIES: ABC transporter ATP-binding protein [Rhodomicrobium]